MQKKIPIIYSESYYVDIGEHVFPTSKYRLIKERVLREPCLSEKFDFLPPGHISEKELELVHTREYLRKLRTGSLSDREVLALEVPFSGALVKAAYTCCAGTVTASRQALSRGAAVHLGGGFHHAFSDHGEGFCVLNDVAVTARLIREQGLVGKILIVDCDVHQGNGTASIFRRDDTIFTFSIHQEKNYPYFKQQSDMDIGLPDGSGDGRYLTELKNTLPGVLERVKPGLIIYVAGADPYYNDQLGGLELTKSGLKERDRYVFDRARERSVPVAVTLAGGYAHNREDTVDIHLATIIECAGTFTF